LPAKKHKPVDRHQFLLQALTGTGRIDRFEKIIYLPFDYPLSPVNMHDINELQRLYKYRLQYEIPCEQ